MRTRRRLASRPSIFSNKLWPEDEHVVSGLSSPKTPTTPASPPPQASIERSDSGIQQSTVEEENTTDWTPEIPFENVSAAPVWISATQLFLQLHHALSGDLDEDLDSINYPYNKQKYDLAENRMRKRGSTFPSTTEQVDDIIDHSIEIESNKRMRSANVNTWTLRFIDKEMEYQVGGFRFVPSKFTLSLLVQSTEGGHVQVQHVVLLHHLALHGGVSGGGDQATERHRDRVLDRHHCSLDFDQRPGHGGGVRATAGVPPEDLVHPGAQQEEQDRFHLRSHSHNGHDEFFQSADLEDQRRNHRRYRIEVVPEATVLLVQLDHHQQ
jgi:hypothetical protein